MKVYIHVDAKGYVEHSDNPYVVAELDFAPNIGDTIWIDEDLKGELESKIVSLYKEKRHAMFREYLYGKAHEMISVTRENWRFITSEIFEASLSLDDLNYVVKRHFVCQDTCLPKGLHIFLSSEEA